MAHIVHDCTIGGAAPSGVELLGSFNPLKETKKTDADRKKRKDQHQLKTKYFRKSCLFSSRRYPRLLHESSSNYLWDKQWRAVLSVSIHVCTSCKFWYKNIVLDFVFPIYMYVKHLFRITCSTATDTVLCQLFGFVTIWVRLQWNIANLDHHFITSWPPLKYYHFYFHIYLFLTSDFMSATCIAGMCDHRRHIHRRRDHRFDDFHGERSLQESRTW